MKVFQLIQKPQLRGAEIFAAQLCGHLEMLGHRCKIISLYQGENVVLPFNGPFAHLNRPLGNRFNDFKGWKQLAMMIAEENPNIVQANAADTLKFAVISKMIFKWKAPIVFRNANKMSDFIDSNPKFWLNRFFLRRVTRIVSVSKTCSEDLKNFFSIPKSKVDTIEIGINLSTIGTLPQDLLPIFAKGPVLLNVASMVREKNQAGLLRIFHAISKNAPDVQLAVIGKGKLEDDLRSQCRQLEIEDRVHFLHLRNDVLQIMQQCKAFLLPSHIEGLPGVILEAMYARCPVFAYDVGGMSEIIINKESGMLFRKDSEIEFATSVVKFLENDKVRDNLVENAFQTVVSRFDNREIALRFSDLYSRIVAD